MARDDFLSLTSDDWFKSLGSVTQEMLLTRGRPLRVRGREFAVRKGDPANGFYGVVSGVLAASSVLEDGREMIFGLLEPGDWFGEASSLDGLPRTHDIQALRNSELLHIAPPVFEELMKDAGFARSIAVLQTGRTRTMFSFFEDAALRTTRARIARRLLQLARGDATALPRTRRVIPITHETFALMLGLTRQTLSLELKAIAATGALSLSYGRVVIESVETLKVLSEL
ncbi:Crp/Fnr family transcriptional regulator [Variovorax sp. J22G21]|uniref:Crp/Fnr family transcriptional regulator n=1 Tax=Variovorax fucosicus TaxID=3053517 RepID=UPI002578B8C2|nr:MULTISPECIES: Crp/Fnr family transcriptional regulator [unclassified Variovorax]MDM0042798.1 Crp/Fnr family transcriptional regulator [Variovorax sp. J22R193]MDM0064807.1 Crp/Fnr family transcriptional regulator [Variovorax sp. J22G21]